MEEIIFIEDSSCGYGHRTYVNAYSADATLAFAVNFMTSGEKCTKNATLQAKKIYIPIDITSDINQNIESIASQLVNCKTLNIAGNGIYTLSKYCGIKQADCDKIVLDVLTKLINNYGCHFTEIRSGGQTGFDEAGIKASIALGIKTICYCPKGWRFRTINGDISNEQEFKNRFLKN